MGTEALHLAPGDRVVHRSQGPCRVERFEEKLLAGQRQSVVVLTRDEDGARIFVPREAVERLLSRAPSGGEAPEARAHLDPQLGSFHWDEATARWTSQSSGVAVSVCPEKINDPAALFDAVRHPLQKLLSRGDAVRLAVAAALLELHNRTWNQTGRSETLEGFASRIQLTALSVHEDGTASAYFSDDDLFWGHAIEAQFSADGALLRAHPVG